MVSAAEAVPTAGKSVQATSAASAGSTSTVTSTSAPSVPAVVDVAATQQQAAVEDASEQSTASEPRRCPSEAVGTPPRKVRKRPQMFTPPLRPRVEVSAKRSARSHSEGSSRPPGRNRSVSPLKGVVFKRIGFELEGEVDPISPSRDKRPKLENVGSEDGVRNALVQGPMPAPVEEPKVSSSSEAKPSPTPEPLEPVEPLETPARPSAERHPGDQSLKRKGKKVI